MRMEKREREKGVKWGGGEKGEIPPKFGLMDRIISLESCRTVQH